MNEPPALEPPRQNGLFGDAHNRTEQRPDGARLDVLDECPWIKERVIEQPEQQAGGDERNNAFQDDSGSLSHAVGIGYSVRSACTGSTAEARRAGT
jgi:hypothetical protein